MQPVVLHLFSLNDWLQFQNKWYACADKVMQCMTFAAGLAPCCTRDRGLKLEVHTREGNPFKMSDLRKVRHAGLWLGCHGTDGRQLARCRSWAAGSVAAYVAHAAGR
jgi:hypothetical protein